MTSIVVFVVMEGLKLKPKTDDTTPVFAIQWQCSTRIETSEFVCIVNQL